MAAFETFLLLAAIGLFAAKTEGKLIPNLRMMWNFRSFLSSYMIAQSCKYDQIHNIYEVAISCIAIIEKYFDAQYLPLQNWISLSIRDQAAIL